MEKQWYEKLFENYGKQYDKEPFVHGTKGECDFLEKELYFDRTLKILDIGCGTGRHTIELTKRGYDVTGIDLSEGQLRRAREKAEEAGFSGIPFLQGDARDLPFLKEFDAVLMLCEGGFPLMETDAMNFAILQNAAKALRPSGLLIFTTLNGLYPLFHAVDAVGGTGEEGGAATYQSKGFDWMTLRDKNITTFTDDDGLTHALECDERYYMPSEITWLLHTLDFQAVEIFGARLGAFSREDALTPADFEMLVVARLRG